MSETFAKLLRFGLIGGLSGAIYFLAVTFFVLTVGVGPLAASLFGYLVSAPLSFIGHRFHTFRSREAIVRQLARFLTTHLTGMALMFGSMHLAVHVLHAPFWVGSLIGTAVVPLISFVVFNLWVFQEQPVRQTIQGGRERN